MHPRRRNTVAANVVGDVVARDRIGHRDHRAFAGGVGKAVRQSCRTGDRRHVQDDATAGFHVSAAAAGDNRNFAFQPELVLAHAHRETPRFQGMKSSWLFCSALVRTSPLATLTARSSTFSPTCSMVASPAMMAPASMSMMSAMR